jgi:hypothetical protein
MFANKIERRTFTMRLTVDAATIIDRLRRAKGVSAAAIVEMAVRDYAKRERENASA